MRTLRYQLLIGTIDKPTYIPPIPTDSDYGGFLTIGETLITDDPHYCTLGWLSEIGKQAIIKLTNKQIDALYTYMYPTINDKWTTYVENGRKGYKFGLVATYSYPTLLRNYDWSWLARPRLVSIENGIATIAFESYFQHAGIKKYSRNKADIYKVKLIQLTKDGSVISNDFFYAYLDANGDYVKLDYEPYYY